MELDDLLLRLKNGDRRALIDIYNLSKRAVYSVAYGVLQNTASAEDVMQETYAKICEKINSYNGGKALAWICSIAKNIAIDEYRKNKTVTSLNENYCDTNCFDSVENNVLANGILEIAKKNLSEMEFLIMNLYLIGGMKHREISKLIGKPPSSVRWIYREALEKVKQAVTEE